LGFGFGGVQKKITKGLFNAKAIHNKRNALGQTKAAPLVPRYAPFCRRLWQTLCVNE